MGHSAVDPLTGLGIEATGHQPTDDFIRRIGSWKINPGFNWIELLCECSPSHLCVLHESESRHSAMSLSTSSPIGLILKNKENAAPVLDLVKKMDAEDKNAFAKKFRTPAHGEQEVPDPKAVEDWMSRRSREGPQFGAYDIN